VVWLDLALDPDAPSVTAADRRTLERIASGERIAADRCRVTLQRLELQGYVRCWPGEAPALTEAGRALLAR
jgi:hypothetical protein